MRFLVSGSSGLIGSRLVSFLSRNGHEVLRLVRLKEGVGDDRAYWDPYAEVVDKDLLKGIDAVVHLSGENIAGRWTSEKKNKIRESRLRTTNYMSRLMTEIDPVPEVLVCASAIGYYGDRGGEILDETSDPGRGFLAEVCRDWEIASEPAVESGVRVVCLRTGMVLSAEGGALKKMLFSFKIGAGGIIGSGEQYWSWIALDDLTGIIEHAAVDKSLQGPVNAVTPQAVINREFTRILGKVLSRPILFPMPAFAARLAFGEMADDLLLASTRVKPARLQATGFSFRFSELEPALKYILEKPA